MMDNEDFARRLKKHDELPDEFDFSAEDAGLLLAQFAGLGKPTRITRHRVVGGGPNLQQVSKDNLLKGLLVPDPGWKIVEFDSSDAGEGRETRITVNDAPDFNDSSTWPTDPAERQRFKAATFMARYHNPDAFKRFFGKGRTASSTTIQAALTFAAGQRLGMPQVSAFGPARRTKISAAIRSALGHWASNPK